MGSETKTWAKLAGEGSKKPTRALRDVQETGGGTETSGGPAAAARPATATMLGDFYHLRVSDARAPEPNPASQESGSARSATMYTHAQYV